MKTQKKPRVRDNQLSSVVIINVYYPLNTEELNSVVNSILKDPDKNNVNIDYCIFIGDRLLITPIIEKIRYCYDINWFGEYCITSYNPAYPRYVPSPKLTMRPMQSLEIQLQGFSLLYMPKIQKLSYILDLFQLLQLDTSAFNIICSCNTKYEEGDYQEWAHFEDHEENKAGLHYFVQNENIKLINDGTVQYLQNQNFTMCTIGTVHSSIEHLNTCWHQCNKLLKRRLHKKTATASYNVA